MKKFIVLIVCVVALAGCGHHQSQAQKRSQNVTKEAITDEQLTIASGLVNVLKAQPLPRFAWSQLRQNLIELQTAQANTTQTTTFFFNQGVRDPIQFCPSIGFPIAATTQLSNPEQKVIETASGKDNGNVTLPQIDPNGVYAGNSTGTFAICLDAQGRAYANYWEGFVQTVTGPAHWDVASHTVELTGPPSFDFSVKR